VLKIHSIRDVNYKFLALAVNFGAQPKPGHEGDTSLIEGQSRGRNRARPTNDRPPTARADVRGQLRGVPRRADRLTDRDRPISRNEDGRRGEVAPRFSRDVRRVVVPRRGAASEIRVQVLVQATVPRAEGRQRTVLGIRRK